ncbi:MAG TPA: RdgB/HAM1 family non-canonical purine NTP pyrophosphatase [Limnobacter sp.]|nr:RdgB/HAM1 family non-canonical purine NTP pyrophosphatase [Limnobacter sp.]
MGVDLTTPWVLASGNAGKLREFQDLFAPWGVQWVAQSTLGVPEAEEPFNTFIENALAKARHASRLTGRPALADDSGLCVPALHGAPGVLSARYATLFGQAKGDANNNACLIAQLQGVADRRAYFVCAMVWVAHADDPTPTIAQKMWWGEVLDQPLGEHGFGYDPHFWLPQHQCTAAQMPKALKNQHSHRAQATASLLAELEQRLGLKRRAA